MSIGRPIPEIKLFQTLTLKFQLQGQRVWSKGKYIQSAQYHIKGAVSYRFSQGLLNLMCNNSKLKADINFFFFLLRRQTSKVYKWLQKFTIQHQVALL